MATGAPPPIGTRQHPLNDVLVDCLLHQECLGAGIAERILIGQAQFDDAGQRLVLAAAGTEMIIHRDSEIIESKKSMVNHFLQ